MDFESKDYYQLSVRATDRYSNKWAEVVVSIQVTDMNDNPPEFLEYFYNITVSEATAIATEIFRVTTTDKDSDVNMGVNYHLENFNGTIPENFYMEGTSGALILKKALDREETSAYHFAIVATDTGSPPLSTTANIYITVLDINDNPPVFENNTPRCTVSQAVPRNHFVTMVTAYDRDVTDYPKLTYSIISGNEKQVFSIDASSGIITTWNIQYLANETQYSLNISVTDSVFTAYTKIVIIVTPVNEHSPVFEYATYTVNVLENTFYNRRLAQILATDEDNGRYGEVTYHFIGDESQKYFKVNENTGEIFANVKFDREKKKEYDFTLQAVDIGGRTGFTTMHVVIDDENDNNPKFLQNSYKSLIRANISSSSVVMQVKANDIDFGANSELQYFFHDSTIENTKGAFSLDSETGEISLLTDASSLSKNNYEFFVEAVDKGIPALRSTATVQLRIVDKDAKLPEFSSEHYILTVPEDAFPGTEIGSVKARWNGDIEYSVEWQDLESSPPILVSPEGILKLVSLLDYEIEARFSLIVIATPKEQPELSSNCIVVIEVQDVNDRTPVFESEVYYVSVAENTPIGSNVIQVKSNDDDSGSNSGIKYEIATDNFNDSKIDKVIDEGIFSLDPYSGWLSLNAELDTELENEYRIKIRGTDSGKPSQTSLTTVVIHVVDYNDNPPKFTQKIYRASVNEDALPGTVVAELEVNDADLIEGNIELEENGVSYYITSGDIGQHFHIRHGGQIYVARKLDRESISRYHLTIKVTDGIFISETSVVIEIIDVNGKCYSLNYIVFILLTFK